MDIPGQLIHWHRWSVDLRNNVLKWQEWQIQEALRGALNGSDAEFGWGSVGGAWVDGPEYDPVIAQALVDGFRELFGNLTRELHLGRHLFEVFDAVEFLPSELMRSGPESVDGYLAGYSRDLPELAPMAQRFRRSVESRSDRC